MKPFGTLEKLEALMEDGMGEDEAIASLAKERDVEWGSIRKALKRDRARRAEEQERLANPNKAPPPPIETCGMHMPQHFLKEVGAIKSAMERAFKHLSSAEKLITSIGLKELTEHIREAKDWCMNDTPASVCVYCKCIPHLANSCRFCHGDLYITSEWYNGAQNILLRPVTDPQCKVVGVNGYLESYLENLADDSEAPLDVEPVIEAHDGPEEEEG